MVDRKITITHNGTVYAGEIATIDRTSLGWESHGIVTASLQLGWDGGGVVFGGYCLDTPLAESGDFSRQGTAYGLDYLMQVMQTVGVENWEDLNGSQVIALFKGATRWGSPIAGIAGLTNKKVFIAQEHADHWRAEEATHG